MHYTRPEEIAQSSGRTRNGIQWVISSYFQDKNRRKYLVNRKKRQRGTGDGHQYIAGNRKNDCQGQCVIRIYLWQKESTPRESGESCRQVCQRVTRDKEAGLYSRYKNNRHRSEMIVQTKVREAGNAGFTILFARCPLYNARNCMVLYRQTQERKAEKRQPDDGG